MKVSLRLLLVYLTLTILLISVAKSQDTDLVEQDEGDEDEDGGECTMNLMCQSCDLERAICSTKGTPCRFSFFYNRTISSCVERTDELPFCMVYLDSYADKPQCAQCVKGRTLYVNEALSKWSCEKETTKHSNFDCIDGCDYCWTRRNSDGTIQKGCAGCSAGWIGKDWIQGEISGKCVEA